MTAVTRYFFHEEDIKRKGAIMKTMRFFRIEHTIRSERKKLRTGMQKN